MSDQGREIAHAGQNFGGDISASQAPREIGIPIEQRMAMLREALTNPDVDPQKAVAMADLMFKLEDRDRQAEFNRALIAAKREIPPIYKRGENTHQHTKYAKFEDIQRIVDPILARHGLSLDFKIGSEGAMITVRPVLRHDNGWVEVGDAIKGPPDEGPGRSKIQSVGSSSSYLQRYAAKGALNLRFDGEDDDGVGGRPGDQPNDRQQTLILDGQAAAEAGTYADWYRKLPAKDRAWMVSTGNHARIGGGLALPSGQDQIEETPEPAKAASAAEIPENQSEPPQVEDPEAARARRKRTPEEMVAAYENGIAGCKSLDDLRDYQAEPARLRWSNQLKEKHPELHERVVKANSRRYSEIIDSMPSSGGLL